MKFEIVNHCYNYGRLLAYQLSSLILHPPAAEHEITYSLFLERDDEKTANIADFYKEKLPKNVKMIVWYQYLPYLRNRAIGRNQAALDTQADWVWFADTDYVFKNVVWDDLASIVKSNRYPDAKFLAPLKIWETDWATGDKLIKEMDTLAVRDVPEGSYVPVTKKVAIGGLQIAHGPTVREIGYASGIAAKGVSDEWNFRSDIAFRRHPAMAHKGSVYLRDVIRIRHTNKGYGQEDRHQVVN